MTQPFDLSRFPDLPPGVMKAFAAQQAALDAARFDASVERAARRHEQAVVAEKDAFITELKDLIGKLEGQVQDYRRTKFGRKSEKLDPAQLELAWRIWKPRLPRPRNRLPRSRRRSRPARPIPGRRRRARNARRAPCRKACHAWSG